MSTLTGTQVLLLVASETGHVYTFATPKLQPLITKPEGKNLIQACLNAPDASEYDAPVMAPGATVTPTVSHPPPPYYPPYPPTSTAPSNGRVTAQDDDYPTANTTTTAGVYPPYPTNTRSNTAYYYQGTGSGGNPATNNNPQYTQHGFWPQPQPTQSATTGGSTAASASASSTNTTPTATPLVAGGTQTGSTGYPNYGHHPAIGHHHHDD